MLRYTAFIFLFYTFLSCTNSTSERALPKSTGKSGDIIILMDSLQWKNDLGHELRKIFNADAPGLPHDETVFNAVWVQPNKKIKLLTQIRNLVYVFTLDQKSAGTRVITENLSAETINKIKNDSSFFLVNNQNEYSKGQEVLYLFGRTEEELMAHLQRDGEKIQGFFNSVERQRILATIKKTVSTKNLTATLEKDFGISLALPAGFSLADRQGDFIWFRFPEAEIDRSLFVARKPYERETQLHPDSVVAWRDEICQRYLFEDPEILQSYITTERDIPFNPVISKKVNLNGRFAIETRGLWRTNTRTMGGPFVSYAFVNQKDNQLYYIEGFVYSPGKNQRELIRELEAIAYSFEDAKPITEAK
jgi:Domain of unknown function (DUF4837)